MFKKIIAFIFFLISVSVYSQKLRLIDTSNYTLRKELIKKQEANNKAFYKKLKKDNRGKLAREIVSLHKSYDNEFLRYFKKNRFIFDNRFTKYTDSIVNEIASKNENLKDEKIKVYIAKSPIINASNIGRGIIILNIGLFKYFKNEDQVISVLTHEIAHEKLKHVTKNAMHRAVLETSKNRKNQAKKIKKQKYNQYNSSFKILKELMYSDSKKRRKREMQADSVGYLFFKKLDLNETNYVSALQLLAKYETLPKIELDSSVYKQFFNIPKQPFKGSWLKMEEFSKYDYTMYTEKINKDSVKSHPEYEERIAKLKKDFPELNSTDSLKGIKNSNFLELQKLAKKEDIVNLFDLKEYGQSIRLILYKLSKNPEDIYLKKWLGKNFLGLYKAKKKYQLNRHLERLNPKEQSKEYQLYLSFIWNLNLEEMKIIGDYYSE